MINLKTHTRTQQQQQQTVIERTGIYFHLQVKIMYPLGFESILSYDQL